MSIDFIGYSCDRFAEHKKFKIAGFYKVQGSHNSDDHNTTISSIDTTGIDTSDLFTLESTFYTASEKLNFLTIKCNHVF